MAYNAIAEQKIHDLIEQASQSKLPGGTVILQQTLKYLNQEFGTSHWGDLPKHDVKRLQVRKRFYQLISVTYERLITNYMQTDENLEKENKGLKDRVEELLSEIADLNEVQQAFKNL